MKICGVSDEIVIRLTPLLNVMRITKNSEIKCLIQTAEESKFLFSITWHETN